MSMGVRAIVAELRAGVSETKPLSWHVNSLP